MADTTLQTHTMEDSPWYSGLGDTLAKYANDGAAIYSKIKGGGSSGGVKPAAGTPAAIASAGSSDWKKYLPIGGAVVGVLIVVAFIFKGKGK